MNDTMTVDLAKKLYIQARVEPAEIAPGSTGTLVVEADIPRQYHIEAHEPPESYLIPTVLEVRAERDIAVGSVRYPTASRRRLAWAPSTLEVYEGRIRMETEITVAGDAPAGLRALTAELRYQAGNGMAGMPPRAQAVNVAIEVGQHERKAA